MEPNTCNNGDLYWMVTMEEVEEAKRGTTIKAPLAHEGEVIPEKKGELVFVPKQSELLVETPIPKTAESWEEMEGIQLKFNSRAYEICKYKSPVTQGGLTHDLYLTEIWSQR